MPYSVLAMLHSTLVGVFVSQVAFLIWLWFAPDLPVKKNLAGMAREVMHLVVMVIAGLFTLALIIVEHPYAPLRFIAAGYVGWIVGIGILRALLFVSKSRYVRRRRREMVQTFVPPLFRAH